MFEFLLLSINIFLGKVYNTVCSFKMFFFFNIFLNTFALMLLDSLCAYLVFLCVFALLLFWFSCVTFSCFSFRFARPFLLFIFIAVLNICLRLRFISLFPSVASPRALCLSIQLRISSTSGSHKLSPFSTFVCVFLTLFRRCCPRGGQRI